MKTFILASGSPRRKELLEQAFLPFTISTSSIDEQINPNHTPSEAVESLARQKATDVFEKNPDAIVLGSDTVVALDQQILGKPKDADHARAMLSQLSGTEHAVYTGVAIVSKDQTRTFHERTSVTFWELTADEIEQYVSTNEPFDKAGAYGIQGFGATLVKSIAGDYFSVVGLPLARTVRELKSFGITPQVS
ncbi:Maf family protein [Desertibacillus haloalkaliphilus]|uniref:Maf family protein n=1 Tax=Desertibacillus haloalkaliphilus TaxID=1328930 RepID=UPI001C278810|nr:Maf family protein [Desertibacillus haloalkaliphilus]MBU8905042.1 Maf family protein [Desertibacillus haloalkaliphilus]